MSMNNKQRWMGGIVLLGGGTLLAALLFKGAHEIQGNHTQEVKPTQQSSASKPPVPAKVEEMQSLQPVTVDIETEKRLLEEQKRTREKVIADQEAKTQQYLAQQQQAEAAAAKKAAQEYAQINARRVKEQTAVDVPPEVTDKPKQQSVDEKKLALEAKQKADLEKKLEAKKQAELEKKAELKKQADAAEKERKQRALEDAKKAEQELKKKTEREQAKKVHEEKVKLQQAQEAKQKEKLQTDSDVQHKVEQSHAQTQNELDHKKKSDAEKAREIMKDESDHKKWMVQVALAANQANADTTIAKLKAKGYKITTSPTSKGIRIMVGPSKSKDHADILRKKIQADTSLNMPSAWVIDSVPLEER